MAISGKNPQNTDPDARTKQSRLRRRQTVVVIGSLVFSIVYVSAFWLNQIFCLPVELYHRVWLTTLHFFFDEDKLAADKFKTFEHKYDDKIKTQADAEKYIALLLKGLEDPFTTFYNARATSRQTDAHEGFYSGVGMVMNSKTHPITVRRVMPGSPAQTAGVKTGDLILAVDGIDCSHIDAAKIGDHTRERMYHPVRFSMSRAGSKLDLTMVPSKIPVVSTTAKILADNIAYERIESFVRKDLGKTVVKDFARLKNCRGLILDLRGNPGGGVDLCLEIASSMLGQGPLVSLKSRTGEGSYLLSQYTLTASDLVLAESQTGKKKAISHRQRLPDCWGKKPMIILIDENSASAAEMVAAALADNHRAILVGERSYGKGIAQL